MSGIAGIFNLDGHPVDEDLLTKMTEAIMHRGSDGEGVWIDGPIGMSHRQFRTTEEALREKQPLSNQRGTCWIACDGRVDNREELIHELRDRDIHIEEPTDAELILLSYEVWGTRCPERIIGDFAFAIWDAKNQQLFCARDPFGVRPFFYYFDGKRLLWGSEIKQMLQDKMISQKLNEAYFAEYLIIGPTGGEPTPYKQIVRLCPAHCLIVRQDGLRKLRYWDIDPDYQIRYHRDEEYAEHFRELFKEAVRCKLRSCSPIMAELSGGLDSSSIVCMAQDIYGREKLPCHGFTTSSIVNNEDRDRIFSQAVINKYKLDAVRINGDKHWLFKDISECLSEGISQWDEPNWEILLYARTRDFLQKIRERNAKVVLSGLGGDQVVGWYGYYLADLLRTFRIQRLFTELKQWGDRLNRSYFMIFREGCLQPFLQSFSGLPFRKPWVPSWVNYSLIKKVNLLKPSTKTLTQARFHSIVNQMHYEKFVGSFGSLIENVLFTKVIEKRYPYFYRPLVEYIMAIPLEQKVHPQNSIKVILRKAMKDILPAKVRMRQDKPLGEWQFYRGVKQEWSKIQQRLKNLRLSALGYINPEEFRRVMELARQGFVRDDGKSLAISRELTSIMHTWALEVWLHMVMG